MLEQNKEQAAELEKLHKENKKVNTGLGNIKVSWWAQHLLEENNGFNQAVLVNSLEFGFRSIHWVERVYSAPLTEDQCAEIEEPEYLPMER